ncbi:hypothetical protein DFH27DRAFT_529492 [Peziza echinospora]|nr:hypothetical protein DFH27DRAFT_529492 [Peziza echinospora]
MSSFFNKAKDTLAAAANAAESTLPHSTGPSTGTTIPQSFSQTHSTDPRDPDVTTTSSSTTYTTSGPRNPSQHPEYQGNSGISHRGPLRANAPSTPVNEQRDSLRDFRGSQSQSPAESARYEESGGFGGRGGRNLMMRDGDGVRGQGESVRDVIGEQFGGGDTGHGGGGGGAKAKPAQTRGDDASGRPTVTTQRYGNAGAVGDAKVELGGGGGEYGAGVGKKPHTHTDPRPAHGYPVVPPGGGASSANPYAAALEFAANHFLGNTPGSKTSATPATAQSSAAHWSGLFQVALDSLVSSVPASTAGATPVDEKMYIDSHRAVYSGGGASLGQVLNAHSLGAAAAMQALKVLTSGSGASTGKRGGAASGAGGQSGGGTNTNLNTFIGTAMAECAKLFETQHPSVASGAVNRQDAIMKTAEMALRLYRDAASSGDAGRNLFLLKNMEGQPSTGDAGNLLKKMAGQHLMGLDMMLLSSFMAELTIWVLVNVHKSCIIGTLLEYKSINTAVHKYLKILLMTSG